MRSFSARDARAILFSSLFVASTGCPSQTDSYPPIPASASTTVAVAPSASGSAEIAPVIPSASAMPSAIVAEPPPQPFDPEKVMALLVWQKDEKARGHYRTQWVERDGDKPKVVAERPGILFMSNASLWTLETTIVKGCSQLARHPNGDVFTINGIPQRARPDMQMPELTRISDGTRVAPWKDGHGYPYTGTQCDPEIEDYGVNVTFDGGMGPFVVTRKRTYEYSGGAHGVRGEDVAAINLDKQIAVELAPQPEDRGAVLNNAAKGLVSKPEEVHANGVLLMYGPNGSGLAPYRYFASAPYSGGTGGNSYSNDFEVSSKKLPLEVTGYGKLPAWAIPVLKPKLVPVFMIPPERNAQFKAQFDAAYVTEKKL